MPEQKSRVASSWLVASSLITKAQHMSWIGQWDVAAFHAINGFAGNWLLDRVANHVQIDLIRGFPFVAPLWYFWVTPSRSRDLHRGTIIQVVVSVMIALVINRAMTHLLPFRVRPMYDPASGFIPMSIGPALNMENWSSFPSDTATFFFGLATGAYLLSRRLGLALCLYAAVVVCLPRAYMGIHYPCDLIVGSLLGVVVVKALARPSTQRLFFCDEIQRWGHLHPGSFSLILGVIGFELIVTFDDVRDLLRDPVVVLRHYGLALAVVLLGVSVAAMIAGFIVLRAKARRTRQPVTQPELVT
jgi:membrane-associated phospholipid phosphatase